MQNELSNWLGDSFQSTKVLFTGNFSTNGAIMVQKGLAANSALAWDRWRHMAFQYAFEVKMLIDFLMTTTGKPASDAVLGEALSAHYSGGNSLPEDVFEWLKTNAIIE